MTNTFYTEYLKSVRWQAKRELWFSTFGKWCRGCKRIDGPIHLHHMNYDRLGNERLSDLIALCPACHRGAEDLHRRIGGGKDRRPATMAFIKKRRSGGRGRV